MAKKYRVTLTDAERKELHELPQRRSERRGLSDEPIYYQRPMKRAKSDGRMSGSVTGMA